MSHQTSPAHEWFTRMETLITSVYLGQKNVLTLPEAAMYSGRSESNLYKLTSTGGIPCYCPEGKMIYFKREELETWLLRNPKTTSEQTETKAISYVTTTIPKVGQRRAGKNAK